MTMTYVCNSVDNLEDKIGHEKAVLVAEERTSLSEITILNQGKAVVDFVQGGRYRVTIELID